MPDEPKWAFDFRAEEIMTRLKDKYNFEKIYFNPFKKKDRTKIINFDKYDLVYIFYTCQYPIVENIIGSKKVIVGIFSYDEWKGIFFDTVKKLKKINAVTVGTPDIYKIFSKHCNNIFYTPTGVNIDFFKPQNKKSNKSFTVGWCGNPNRKVKGFEEYITPACKKAGVKLLTATAGNKITPREKMPEFYNKIDCLLCASESEGGAPNPNFEAASCGKPVISTKVGLMPEFIKNGHNGLFIKRDVSNIVNEINKLKNNQKLCKSMGLNARKSIIKNWDWNIMINNYDKVFQFCLNNLTR